MDTYVVECRNKDAIQLTRGNTADGINNGDWITNLNGNNIMLETGDSIICRNSYIDTKAQSENKIVIPDGGINCNIDFIRYNLNWNGSSRKFDTGDWETTPTSVKVPIHPVNNQYVPNTDGEIYVSCRSHSNPTSFYSLDYLEYQGVYDLQNVGGFDVVARYTDTQGQTATKKVYLKKFLEWIPGAFSSVYIGIIYDTSIIPENQTNACEIFVANSDGTPNLSQRIDGTDNTSRFFQDTQMGDVASVSKLISGDAFEPVVANVPLNIPSGNYDPQELCEYINQKLTEVQGQPSAENLSNNPLLVPIGGDNPTLNSDFNNFVPIIDKNNDFDLYGFKNNTSGGAKARICGASQFVLSYKDDTNRFSFQFLHTPLYAGADGNNGSDAERVGFGVAQQFRKNANTNPPNPAFVDKYFKCDKDGGIAFTKLDPPEFWADILGFDINPFQTRNGRNTKIPNPNSLVVNYSLQQTQTGTTDKFTVCGTDSTVPVFLTKPSLGKQITGGFMGIASTFDKSSGFQEPFVLGATNVDGATQDKQVAVGQQVSDIDADKTQFASTGLTTFGYFLVEVKAQFANNFLAPDGNFKSIVAIVSRFYEKASYTSSSSSDSIIYTHKGEPSLLSSFRCRILDPSKELAQNVGVDNTVILEIIKAQKPPPQAIEDKKK